MAEDKDRMVWIDLEMTGLDVTKESIIEIATVVTDGELNILAITPDLFRVNCHRIARLGGLYDR